MLQAGKEGLDQTAQMRCLISAYFARICDIGSCSMLRVNVMFISLLPFSYNKVKCMFVGILRVHSV